MRKILFSLILALVSVEASAQVTIGNGVTVGPGTGGTSSVNGTAVANPNFNNTTPGAGAGFALCDFQSSGFNVSAECPQPMTAQYDMIVGGAAGVPARLATANNSVLTTSGSGAQQWSTYTKGQPLVGALGGLPASSSAWIDASSMSGTATTSCGGTPLTNDLAGRIQAALCLLPGGGGYVDARGVGSNVMGSNPMANPSDPTGQTLQTLGGVTILLPCSTIKLQATIFVWKQVHFVGCGVSGTTIQADPSTGVFTSLPSNNCDSSLSSQCVPLVCMSNTAVNGSFPLSCETVANFAGGYGFRVSFEHMAFDGNGVANTTLIANANCEENCYVRDIIFKGFLTAGLTFGPTGSVVTSGTYQGESQNGSSYTDLYFVGVGGNNCNTPLHPIYGIFAGNTIQTNIGVGGHITFTGSCSTGANPNPSSSYIAVSISGPGNHIENIHTEYWYDAVQIDAVNGANGFGTSLGVFVQNITGTNAVQNVVHIMSGNHAVGDACAIYDSINGNNLINDVQSSKIITTSSAAGLGNGCYHFGLTTDTNANFFATPVTILGNLTVNGTGAISALNGQVNTQSLNLAGNGTAGGYVQGVEGAAPSLGITGTDLLYSSSSAHCLELNNNDGGANCVVNSASGPLVNTGGVLSAILTEVNPQNSTYQVLASDFANYNTITIPSGSFTITLVPSSGQPPAGQYITLINYGSGTVSIARSGQNINGGTSSLILGAASATAPVYAKVISDGSNYFALEGGSGTAAGVTSFSGDGNIITNSVSTGSVTTAIAGTSGGVPYFSSSSAWQSSAALALKHVLLGGGAGAAPSSDSNLDDGATNSNTLTYAGSGGVAASSGPITASPSSTSAVAGTFNNPTSTTANVLQAQINGSNEFWVDSAGVAHFTNATSLPTGSSAVTQAPGDGSTDVANDAFVVAAITPCTSSCDFIVGTDSGGGQNPSISANNLGVGLETHWFRFFNRIPNKLGTTCIAPVSTAVNSDHIHVGVYSVSGTTLTLRWDCGQMAMSGTSAQQLSNTSVTSYTMSAGQPYYLVICGDTSGVIPFSLFTANSQYAYVGAANPSHTYGLDATDVCTANAAALPATATTTNIANNTATVVPYVVSQN